MLDPDPDLVAAGARIVLQAALALVPPGLERDDKMFGSSFNNLIDAVTAYRAARFAHDTAGRGPAIDLDEPRMGEL